MAVFPYSERQNPSFTAGLDSYCTLLLPVYQYFCPCAPLLETKRGCAGTVTSVVEPKPPKASVSPIKEK